MFIQTEATDDPASLKFLPGREVVPDGTVEIADRVAAARSPLAARLFDIDGVAALSFGFDYIVVTKSKGEWQHLKPALLGTIMEHFMAGAPIFVEPAKAGSDGPTQTGGMATSVKDALKLVIDPELGYNIVDLGLIYGIAIQDGGTASIIMTTTTRGCPATEYLKQGAREAATAVEGIEAADVTLTYEPHWSPAMMSPEAKDHFGIMD